MTNLDDHYDAVVIGAGPSGLTTAALLARRGWHVAVLERHSARYNLPRAGHIDHEIVRILQGVGAHAGLIEDAPELDEYRWYNGDGELLLSFPFGVRSVSGFQADFMMFQPVLDDALHAAIDRHPRASVHLGAEVRALHPGPDGVALDIARTRTGADGVLTEVGEHHRITADYVIAADGARSGIRDRVLRTERTDLGFNETWLVVDVRLKQPVPPEINGQWCDPARPIYIGPLGKRYHRFECALLPGETVEDAMKPETAWNILAGYSLGPDAVELFRQVAYTFEARVAQRWRDDRIFLVGDAAHTMPPFVGQGLCAGIRDAANLAWKLDLVHRGVAADELLDSYQAERRPHVERWIDIAIATGRLSQVFDPELAAERDRMLRSGELPPLPDPPRLPSVLLGDLAGCDAAGSVGELFVQDEVATGTQVGLLHDVFGHGFLLVGADGDPRRDLGAAELESRVAIEARAIWVSDGADVGDGADEGAGEGAFVDRSGRFAEFFARTGLAAVLVRPDYSIAGGVANPADLPDLIRNLSRGLHLRPVSTGSVSSRNTVTAG